MNSGTVKHGFRAYFKIKRTVLLVFAALATDIASAEDGRKLRAEASGLISKAEFAQTARERQMLLEEARGKLLEIGELYPSEPSRLTLYLAGERVSLTLEDLELTIASARLAEIDAGRLPEVLERSLSPVAADENGWTDLHWAALLNLPDLASGLLGSGADIGAKLKQDGEPVNDSLKRSIAELGLDIDSEAGFFFRLGQSPLHAAAAGNAVEIAEMLIERGAVVDAEEGGRWTPLHAAASGNAVEAAEMLIERGSNVHAKDDIDLTPLHEAALVNAVETAELLIKRGANIRAGNSIGLTPLHEAAWNDSLEAAAMLIEYGADIYAEDDEGRSPLALAEESGAQAVAGLLRKRSAEIDERLSRMEIGSLRVILGRSPSPDFHDGNGWTDLHWAAALNLDELADGLLDAGAEVDPQLENSGEPLTYSLVQSLSGIAPDFEVDPIGKHGLTPLHVAAWSNAAETADLLIHRGAEFHATDFFGRTPLHVAAWRNAKEAAAALIRRGADLHARDSDEWTPLHWAAAGNAAETASLLIERGADIHALSRFDSTPLHIAAGWNAAESARILIGRGADLHATDDEGRTPLSVAKERGSQSVYSLLE